MAEQSQPKIIVLDDDPTGSQTVHSCLLLLKWDVDTLMLGLQDESPIFFVLTNTRSLTPAKTAAVTREVCDNLKAAIERTAASGLTQNFVIVSRSDSTLRGHYPIETDVIAERLGPFDAHFLTPEFFEAGRITLDSTHYIQSGDTLTPTHETEFAKDSVFGYSTAYLPDYVEEKTKGAIPASKVERFLLADIRQGTQKRLMQLNNNCCVAVDGEQQSDLDQFATDLNAVAAQGKRFLFRSAASLLTSLANLPPQPTRPADMSQITRSLSGAVIVGSHVQKTTQQLQQLLKAPGVVGIEIDVTEIKADPQNSHDRLLKQVLDRFNQIHAEGHTPAVYTSREELTFEDSETRLAFGEAVSTLLVDIEKSLPKDIGFLISKGGITSNDMLSKGLELTFVRLLGQIIPGVSIVKTEATHPSFPSLPVVLFPGNVGDADALAIAYQRLANTE